MNDSELVLVPKEIRAMLVDLHLTLVTRDLKQPLPGALDFLQRTASHLGPNSAVIFSMDLIKDVALAYLECLQQPSAIKLGGWQCNVAKPNFYRFSDASFVALNQLEAEITAEEVVYIDDSPYGVLHAMQFGFGYVVFVNDDPVRLAWLVEQAGLDNSMYVKYFEGFKPRLVMVESVEKIHFEAPMLD